MSDKNSVLQKLLKSLEDMQATDIKVMDVRQQTTITDTMILACGRSSRHVKSIAQKVVEDLKHLGIPSLSCSGLESGEWVLVDFGDYIVHVMQPESRLFYNLEGLWEVAS